MAGAPPAPCGHVAEAVLALRAGAADVLGAAGALTVLGVAGGTEGTELIAGTSWEIDVGMTVEQFKKEASVIVTLAFSGEGVAPKGILQSKSTSIEYFPLRTRFSSHQTLVALPSPRVSRALPALPRAVVAPTGGEGVGVP